MKRKTITQQFLSGNVALAAALIAGVVGGASAELTAELLWRPGAVRRPAATLSTTPPVRTTSAQGGAIWGSRSTSRPAMPWLMNRGTSASARGTGVGTTTGTMPTLRMGAGGRCIVSPRGGVVCPPGSLPASPPGVVRTTQTNPAGTPSGFGNAARGGTTAPAMPVFDTGDKVGGQDDHGTTSSIRTSSSSMSAGGWLFQWLRGGGQTASVSSTPTVPVVPAQPSVGASSAPSTGNGYLQWPWSTGGNTSASGEDAGDGTVFTSTSNSAAADAFDSCSDTQDNDGDGRMNMLDVGCYSTTLPGRRSEWRDTQGGHGAAPPGHCVDNSDNDTDTFVDWDDQDCQDGNPGEGMSGFVTSESPVYYHSVDYPWLH